MISKEKIILPLFAMMLFISFAALNIGMALFTSPYIADFTPDKKYTLNIRTQKWLQENRKNIYVRVYASPEFQKSYLPKVLRHLEQYQRQARNRLSLKIIETEAFTPAAAEAEKFGILPLGSAQKPNYFGLVIADENGNSRTISYLSPSREAYLQHDISRAMSALGNNAKPQIGILSPALPLTESSSSFDYTSEWPFVTLLKQYYHIRRLDNGIAQIPPALKTVIIVNPRDIDNKTVYALDQYLLRGGNLIIFFDALSESRLAEDETPDLRPSGLQQFIQNLGISYNAEPHNPKVRIIKHTLTENLSLLNFRSAGSFEIEEEKGSYIPILSSEQGLLAVLAEGRFFSLYNTPPFEITGGRQLPFVSASIADGRVLLISDSDMLNAALWRSEAMPDMPVSAAAYISNNMDFVEKAVDDLSGNTSLLNDIPAVFSSCQTPATRLREKVLAAYQAASAQIRAEQEKNQQELEQLRQDISNGSRIISLKIIRQNETLQKNILAAEETLRQQEILKNRKIRLNENLLMLSNILLFPALIISLIYTAVWLKRRRNRRLAEEYAND